ncbi:hypothetical protein EDB92DRAFT_1948056 [Lactarius akahatsu]|uniref:GST N-terminal domain-containing protein n=1 Tax=Lactarius akahatsu TaxID=416441 RepID=A0AAD4QC30_9AGAM|nr:hypothetical protein EDB92DRAFT_1948056 [Lactarius akahatsu]
MTKPVLYTFPQSVWAVSLQLSLAELDVDADLKISPHGALPTLAHGGKSFSNAAVIDYLVSISSKKVAPATSITIVVYEDKIDPNFAFVASVRFYPPIGGALTDHPLPQRNDEEFAKVKGSFAPIFMSTHRPCLFEEACRGARGGTAQGLLRQGDRENLPSRCAHAKQGFYSASTAVWDSIKVFAVETLPAAISEGPFIGVATPGVDDYHVGAWIARIAFLLGAQKSDEGVAVLEKGFGPIPEKVKVYWSAWTARDSWVKAYPDRVLH